jgi:hypothetical protein
MCAMARKHHHMPLFGGDRKALTKELSKSRAMTHIFAERSAEKRREGTDPGSRQSGLSKLERTHVVRWRPHRSVTDNRSSHQWRIAAVMMAPRSIL